MSNDDDEPLSRLPDIGRRRRRSVLLRLLGKWVLSLLLVGVIVGAIGGWSFLEFTAPGPLTADKVYEIGKSVDRPSLAIALHEQGIISEPRIFSAAAAVNAWRGGRLKPGEYLFKAGMSMQDVLLMITAGRVITYKLSVPEGWTAQMVVDRLGEQKELDGPVPATPPEGSIMPDTYVFRRGLAREKLLADMQDAQSKLVDEVWAAKPADSILKSKQEMVTLASIVEKETGVPEERPIVASVMINRLKQHIRLQSDPTVIYGITMGKTKLERPISKADLDAETPYNTYRIDGLPPGPIANPGKAALEAVINPANTNYLYFVADGSGGHAFAATLEEHNANVKKWRGLEAAAAADPPKPAEAPAAAPAATAPAATVAAAATAAPAAAPVAAATAAPTSVPVKPGSTVLVNGKKVPIPVFKKPKKP
jgi:UPF0755 protein